MCKPFFLVLMFFFTTLSAQERLVVYDLSPYGNGQLIFDGTTQLKPIIVKEGCNNLHLNAFITAEPRAQLLSNFPQFAVDLGTQSQILALNNGVSVGGLVMSNRFELMLSKTAFEAPGLYTFELDLCCQVGCSCFRENLEVIVLPAQPLQSFFTLDTACVGSHTLATVDLLWGYQPFSGVATSSITNPGFLLPEHWQPLVRWSAQNPAIDQRIYQSNRFNDSLVFVLPEIHTGTSYKIEYPYYEERPVCSTTVIGVSPFITYSKRPSVTFNLDKKNYSRADTVRVKTSLDSSCTVSALWLQIPDSLIQDTAMFRAQHFYPRGIALEAQNNWCSDTFELSINTISLENKTKGNTWAKEACIGDSLALAWELKDSIIQRIQYRYELNGQWHSHSLVNRLFPTKANYTFVVDSSWENGAVEMYTNKGALLESKNLYIRKLDPVLVLPVDTFCSAKEYTFLGYPLGGLYTLKSTRGNIVDTLIGSQWDAKTWTSYINGQANIEVGYTVLAIYSDGTPCANSQTISTPILLENIGVDTIITFPISISEQAILLKTLIDSVYGRRLGAGARFYYSGIGIKGDSIFPAQFTKGQKSFAFNTLTQSCSALDSFTIDFLAAPIHSLSKHPICSPWELDTIKRAANYPYNIKFGYLRQLEEYVMEIANVKYNSVFSPLTFSQLSRAYLLDTSMFIKDTLVYKVNYTNIITDYTQQVPIGIKRSRVYTVASFLDTIVLAKPVTTDILQLDTGYCETSGYQRIAMSHTSGQLSIQQMNGDSLGKIFGPYKLQQAYFYLDIKELYGEESTQIRYQLIYERAEGICLAFDTAYFSIYPSPILTLQTVSGNKKYCFDEGGDSLLINYPNGFLTLNGSLLQNKLFFPRTALKGPNILHYSYQDTNTCRTNLIDTLWVNSPDSLAFLPKVSKSYCPRDTAVFLKGQSALGRVVSISLSALGRSFTQHDSILFIPSYWGGIGADSVVLKMYTQGGGACIDSSLHILYIRPSLALQIIGIPDSLCLGGATIAINVKPKGGHITSSFQSNIDTLTFRYTPSFLTNGKDVLKYTYLDSTGCLFERMDSVEVIGGSVPVSFTTLPPDTLCLGMDSLLIRASTFRSGAYFSTNPIGLIQGQNRDSLWISTKNAPVDSFIVRYSYLTIGGCEQVITKTFYLHSKGARILTQDSFCLNTGVHRLSLVQQTSNIHWIRGGSSFDTDTMVAGDYPVLGEVVFQNGCTLFVEDTIKLLANPKPIIQGYRSQYCSNDLSRDTLYAAPVNGTWSTSSSVFLVDPIRNTIFFEPQNAPYGKHTIDYSIVAQNGCLQKSTAVLEVDSIPLVQVLSPLDSHTYCSNEADVPINILVGGDSVRPTSIVELNSVGGLIKEKIRLNALTGRRTITISYRDTIGGCLVRRNLDFFVAEAPTAHLNGLPKTFCNQDTSVLALSDSSTQGYALIQKYQCLLVKHQKALVGLTNKQFDLGLKTLNQSDTCRYTVLDSLGCTDTIYHTLVQKQASRIGYFYFKDTILCENSPVVSINNLTYSGTDFFDVQEKGRTSTLLKDTSTFIFSPSQLGVGKYNLRYSHENVWGCTGDTTVSFEVHPVPKIDYVQHQFCLGDTIEVEGVATVLNPLVHQDTQLTYTWWVAGNLSANTRDLHKVFSSAGWSHLTFKVKTAMGCSDTVSSNHLKTVALGDTLKVYAKPVLDLSADQYCTGDSLHLKIEQSNPFLVSNNWDKLTYATCDWGDRDIDTIDWSGQTTFLHQYNIAKAYTLKIDWSNQGCSGVDSLKLSIAPVFNLTKAVPYLEDFNKGNQGWSSNTSIDAQKWSLGGGLGTQFVKADSLDTFWSVNEGLPYAPGTEAHLYTPCFNINDLERPAIFMDYWSDLYELDGVMLEYYDKTQNRWVLLGEVNKGINWYASNQPLFGLLPIKTIDYINELKGWTGKTSQWVSGRYALDALSNIEFLQLRFSFGSLANIPNTTQLEGFAVDNFQLKSRERRVLGEYFSHIDMPLGTQNYLQLYQKTALSKEKEDLILVDYHIINEKDPLYTQNKEGPDVRKLYYGISKPNRLFLSGQSDGIVPPGLVLNKIDSLALTDVGIDLLPQGVTCTAAASGYRLDMALTLEASKPMPFSNYQLMWALVTDSVEVNGFLY